MAHSIMFLLFRVGLEVKASRWKQIGWTGTLSGVAASFVAHRGGAMSRLADLLAALVKTKRRAYQGE